MQRKQQPANPKPDPVLTPPPTPHLVVLLPLVQHLHHPNGLRAQEAHGHDGLLHQHQHVQRVGVLAQRLGDEPVVVGVDDAGVEDAVDVAEAGT